MNDLNRWKTTLEALSTTVASSSSPIVTWMLETHWVSVENYLSNEGSATNPQELVGRIYHPLSLCAALASLRVFNEDPENILTSYCTGGSSNALSIWKSSLFSHAKPHELLKFFSIELEIRSTLLKICLAERLNPFFSFRMPSSQLDNLLTRFRNAPKNAGDLDEVSLHRTHWNCWYMVNPLLSMLPPEISQALLFRIGFSNNEDWLRFGNESRRQLSSLNKEINRLLKEKDFVALSSLKEQHEAVLATAKYSELYYWWNPCEADAFATSAMILNELTRADVDLSDSSKLNDKDSV